MDIETSDLRAELILTRTDIELDSLRSIFVRFFDESDEDLPEVGSITGWVIWSALDADVAFEGDAYSADSSLISLVGQKLLRGQGWEDNLIDNLLLINRVWIKKEYRGRGFLRVMIDQIIDLLRFDELGCFLVAQLEPQKPQGGSYGYGPVRDKAMRGLTKSFVDAGFVSYQESAVFYRCEPGEY